MKVFISCVAGYIQLKHILTFDNFTDFYKDCDFHSHALLFNGATHTTANAGDLIIKKILIRKQ